MNVPNDTQIDRLIARREKLTNRRDEHINIPAVNEIDSRLRLVPQGERQDVDKLLGRAIPSLETVTLYCQKCGKMFVRFVARLTPIVICPHCGARIEDDPLNWRDMRGDLAL